MRTKIFILSLFLGVLGVLAGTYFIGNHYGKKTGFKNAYQNAANKLAQNPQPKIIDFSDSELDVDQQLIMNKLYTSIETDSAQKVFSDVMHTIHHKTLALVYEKAEVPSELRKEMIDHYECLHQNLADQYFFEFKNKTKASKVATEPHYYRKAYDLGEQFGLTISEGICDLLFSLRTLTVLTKKESPLGLVKDIISSNICSSILNSLFPELRKDLREAGLYHDMHSVDMLFDNHMRKQIAEVATAQDIIQNIVVTKTRRKTMLKYFSSTAKLKAIGNARVKAGIDIMELFKYEVTPQTKTMTVTVANPEILSNEINYKIVSMKDGLFSDITKEMHNDIHNSIAAEVEISSKKRAILDAAKQNFEDFFEAIISPSLKFRGIEKIEFEYINKGVISPETLKG